MCHATEQQTVVDPDGRSRVETYLSLVTSTGEGVQHMEESPKRLDAARDVVESLGGELTEFYLTMGQYDAVAVMEMPTRRRQRRRGSPSPARAPSAPRRCGRSPRTSTAT